MSAALLFGALHALATLTPEAMPPMHRLVLLAFADYAGDDGQAWPSAANVGRVTGQAPRTVETCVAELRAAGWLHLEAAGGGRRATNTYSVRVDGGPVARGRQGRHGNPAPRADTAPRADPVPAPLAVVSDAPPRAPCGGGTAPRAGNPAPRADNPIRIRSSEPIPEIPPTPQGAVREREQAVKPSPARERYAAAFAAGLAAGAPGESKTPPLPSAFGAPFGRALAVHAKGMTGEALDAWIRTTVADWRRTADARFQRGWAVPKLLEWLDGGRGRAGPGPGVQQPARTGEFDWRNPEAYPHGR